MKFEIYGQRFSDDVLVAGEKEVPNPQYDGKCIPVISIRKNTGEVMETRLEPVDSDYWANADVVTHPVYSFIVQELGGEENITAMLEVIIAD